MENVGVFVSVGVEENVNVSPVGVRIFVGESVSVSETEMERVRFVFDTEEDSVRDELLEEVFERESEAVTVLVRDFVSISLSVALCDLVRVADKEKSVCDNVKVLV